MAVSCLCGLCVRCANVKAPAQPFSREGVKEGATESSAAPLKCSVYRTPYGTWLCTATVRIDQTYPTRSSVLFSAGPLSVHTASHSRWIRNHDCSCGTGIAATNANLTTPAAMWTFAHIAGYAWFTLARAPHPLSAQWHCMSLPYGVVPYGQH